MKLIKIITLGFSSISFEDKMTKMWGVGGIVYMTND